LDSLLLAPVQLAPPHSIPFRTIFEEHLRREQPNFIAALPKVFPATPTATSETLLEEAICAQEAAYSALASAYQQIKQGRPTGPELELKACAESERKLKEVLHETNASALCLSGGGIRSASFCLGVLEGLARISRNPSLNAPVPSGSRPNGLLDQLDYLSTVSGGGYIGSWLMSWAYRRMKANCLYPKVTNALERTLDCTERARAVCLDTKRRVSAPSLLRGSKEDAELGERLWLLTLTIRKGLENADTAVAQAATIPNTDPKFGQYCAAAKEAQGKLNCANLFGNDANGAVILARPELAANLATIAANLAAAAAAVRGVYVANWKKSYGEVVDALADTSNSGKSTNFVTGGDPEPQQVRHLRSYTSFLAPELGATLDTSTLAAIVMRNLVVNWAMLLPILFAALSLVRSSSFLLERAHAWFILAPASPWAVSLSWIPLTAAMLLAALTAAVSLPSHFAITKWNFFRKSPAWLFVFPVFAGSWLLTASASASLWGTYSWGTFSIALVAFLLMGSSIFLAYRERVTGRMVSWGRGAWTVLSVIVAAAAACAALVSLLLWTLENFLLVRLANYQVFLPGFQTKSPSNAVDAKDWLFVVFALPLVTLALMTSGSMFCALLGIYEMEEDREWWVRAGGWILALDVLWMAGHALVLYGTGFQHAVITGVTGLAVGAAGSFVGFSGSTSAGTRAVKSAQLTTVGKFLTKHNLIMPAVSLVAVILVATAIVALEEKVRGAILDAWPCQLAWLPQWAPQDWLVSTSDSTVLGFKSAVVVLIGSTLLAVVMNWAININLFSLQGMYRMRLMRAFLGASNTFRRENPFTHFDPKDTPYETDLPSAPGAPLHVINTTLNLVGTTNPAWMQRKAESFTFSPIHAGSWRLGYVPARLYGGSKGVTVATAMAISGAAFNPNMGYQSSPLLSMLMTFFNLRLGYWLPNPKRPTSDNLLATQNENFFSKSGPSFALIPLIEELLGKSDDTSRWIELTDGGHFENLGLYEMVLRRVKRIIVVDAGADPKFQFEDLGNAVRKIQIDLGVPIEFVGKPGVIEAGDLKAVEGMNLKNWYCAVARIRYHCVDTVPKGTDEDLFDGYLVYIKASLTGREPMDVIQYAKTHETFPHESTANQFFNEPQFESYRKLGSFILETIEARAQLQVQATMIQYRLNQAAAIQTGKTAPAFPAASPYQAFLAGAQ
jgi:hypothetical protein